MQRLTALALGAVVVVALASCGDDDTTSAATDTTLATTAAPAATVTVPASAASAPADTHNQADVNFTQGMIPHHQQAVEVAEMVLQRGADPGVNELAQRIQDAQDPEIVTMTGWLQAWGEPPTSGMGGMDDSDMGGMMSEQDMASLEQAGGPDLDRMFVDMMIQHHQGAIDMATTEVVSGQFPDAVALAKSIITSQQAEIEQMQQLQSQLG